MMMSTVTSSYKVAQAIYEDPDALMSAITDGGESEVRVKPVPRPRSKVKPKGECNTTSNTDTVPAPSSTADAVDSRPDGHPAKHSRPRPARPPPKPPVGNGETSSQPTPAADGGSCENSNIDTTVKPPDVSTERIHSPPSRPERPRLPSIYYDRMRLTSEVHTEERQRSSYSSISSVEGSPVPSEKDGSVSGCDDSSTADSTDRPAVPPRLRQSPLPCTTSQYENLPSQSRPPLPPIKAPTSPSTDTPTESVYSEIEYRPYLDILPEDDDDSMTLDRSSIRSGQSLKSGCSSRKQTLSDTEDVNAMLRWLKRVSKNNFMNMSVYGLSLEEEIRSFHEKTIHVRKALRLYNLLMMKRHDSLRDLITEFTSISLCLDKVQKKNKAIGIAGGTTGAVGGVTAVLGIALAPVTLGASLIATVVGAGMVASAGGVGAHAAKKANKKIVNRMAVERLVYEYKSNIVDLEHCLDFILSGMNELRRHDIARLQRAGAQVDALRMAHLSQFVLKNHTDKVTSALTAGTSSERMLLVFANELDQYFSEKGDQKLKKSKRSRFSGSVRLLAENLQVELDHLNHMWEMFG